VSYRQLKNALTYSLLKVTPFFKNKTKCQYLNCETFGLTVILLGRKVSHIQKIPIVEIIRSNVKVLVTSMSLSDL